mmetsp:Transcript_33296/g.43918  ORF Transcript_33296/g.43918 Transcript_33296/m.43918 type:complete len:127 (-) Transcript_33296:232-612(-)
MKNLLENFFLLAALILILSLSDGASRFGHSNGQCGEDCKPGRCLFKNCDVAGSSCSGGACEFRHTTGATCAGGRCKFISCKESTCQGGGCYFENPKETLRDGYCNGGGCYVDGERWPSRIEGGLTI